MATACTHGRTASARPRSVLVLDPDPVSSALVTDTVRTLCAPADVRAGWTPGGLATASLDDVGVVVAGTGASPATRFAAMASVLEHHDHLPIVLLVPAGEPALADEALCRGASDVLVRTPGYLDQLPVMVRKHLRTERFVRAGTAASAAELSRAVSALSAENTTLRALVNKLESLAATDPLTGLGNRRAAMDRLSELLESSQRYAHGLSCLMMDLDGLKQLNDTLGHAAGDQAIQIAADTIRATLRRSDFAARFGGDELFALLPHSSLESACAIGERIVAEFTRRSAELRLRLDQARRVPGAVQVASRLSRRGSVALGLSVGVAHVGPADRVGPEGLVALADQALYAAKRAGRGRVVPAARPVAA